MKKKIIENKIKSPMNKGAEGGRILMKKEMK